MVWRLAGPACSVVVVDSTDDNDADDDVDDADTDTDDDDAGVPLDFKSSVIIWLTRVAWPNPWPET